MKWLKRLGIAGVVLIALFVVGGMLLPSDYHVERSVDIGANPATVHKLVGDLQEWDSWQPWVDMDPTIETTYGPTTTGAGASQSWQGDTGAGELTVTRSDEHTGVDYDMAFIMQDQRVPATGSIVYEAAGDGTKVTWQMDGPAEGLIGRYVSAFLMKPAIGKAFQAGLDKLKDRAEALAASAPEEELEEAAAEAAEG